MKYTPAKGIDTFKDKTLVITFPPKFLDSFKIKVLNPLKTRQQNQNAFWLFVKESFSFFFYDQTSFSKTSSGDSNSRCSPRNSEGVTSRPTCGSAGTNSKRKIRTAAQHEQS